MMVVQGFEERNYGSYDDDGNYFGALFFILSGRRCE